MLWFTADTHFEFQPKGFIRPADEHLVDQINEHVWKDDTLVICGDFNEKRPGYWRKRLKCKNVKFVLGNHDRTSRCKDVFGNINQIMNISYEGTRVVCAHYPIAYWEGSHKGWYHVYGHTHAQREQTLDECFPGRRSIDVGVFNAHRLFGEYRPFSIEDVIDNTGDGHDPLSFYRG